MEAAAAGTDTQDTSPAICQVEGSWHFKTDGGLLKKGNINKHGSFAWQTPAWPLCHSHPPPYTASFSCCQASELVLLLSSEFLDSEALSAASLE